MPIINCMIIRALTKYQVSTIALIQFIAMSLFGIANAINSIVVACKANDGSCGSSTFTSLVYFLLIVGWFAVLWVLAFTAQQTRSRKLAFLLMGAEGLVAMIALFNANNHVDLLGLVTSVVDLVLAIWIILLAMRLLHAGNTRLVVKQPRRRRRKNS